MIGMLDSSIPALHCGQLLSIGLLLISRYVAHQQHLSHKMNARDDEGELWALNNRKLIADYKLPPFAFKNMHFNDIKSNRIRFM